MKNIKNTFLKAILAGNFIAIAAIIYMTILIKFDNIIIASLMFSFGLLVIVARNYNLFTGKIGYLLPYKKGNIRNISLILLGNIVGVSIIAILVYITKLNFNGISLQSLSQNFVSNKLDHMWYETFILSIFCGILMYIAVDSNKLSSNNYKVVIIIGAVMIFLIAGFEHSIANIFYAVLANVWSVKLIAYLLIMILGNSVGGVVMNLLNWNNSN